METETSHLRREGGREAGREGKKEPTFISFSGLEVALASGSVLGERLPLGLGHWEQCVQHLGLACLSAAVSGEIMGTMTLCCKL